MSLRILPVKSWFSGTTYYDNSLRFTIDEFNEMKSGNDVVGAANADLKGRVVKEPLIEKIKSIIGSFFRSRKSTKTFKSAKKLFLLVVAYIVCGVAFTGFTHSKREKVDYISGSGFLMPYGWRDPSFILMDIFSNQSPRRRTIQRYEYTHLINIGVNKEMTFRVHDRVSLASHKRSFGYFLRANYNEFKFSGGSEKSGLFSESADFGDSLAKYYLFCDTSKCLSVFFLIEGYKSYFNSGDTMAREDDLASRIMSAAKSLKNKK